MNWRNEYDRVITQSPDDLYPELVGECPGCGNDTRNFVPHGCDEYCLSGGSHLMPAECEECQMKEGWSNENN
jgi:hypothetical protein